MDCIERLTVTCMCSRYVSRLRRRCDILLAEAYDACAYREAIPVMYIISTKTGPRSKYTALSLSQVV